MVNGLDSRSLVERFGKSLARFTKSRYLFLLGAFLLSILFLSGAGAVQGQGSAAYWRYDAPGRLNLIETADINLDGVQEFVVVAGGTSFVVVGSDGRGLWSASFQNEPEPTITHVAALNILEEEDEPGPTQEIVVTTNGYLYLYGANTERVWRRPMEGRPAHIIPVDSAEEGLQDILVAQENGNLLLFNGEGQITWRYRNETNPPAQFAAPQVKVADLDRNGSQEIIFTYLTTANFTKIVVVQPGADSTRWESSTSGLITALAIVEFDPAGPLEIAVATNEDEEKVYLYSATGFRRWPYRTPNRPVTSLEMVQLAEGPALVVGTAVGNVIAYDEDGRRYWSGPYSTNANRPVLAISPSKVADPNERPAAMSIVLGQEPGSTEAADVLLVDDSGRQLEPSFPSSDPNGLTRLLDINNDGYNELLLAGFASMELLDPGIGAREFSEAWDYVLEAEPRSVLIGDIQNDGVDELLVGTADGKLTILQRDGQVLWETELGGVISQIAIADMGQNSLPYIVATHNNSRLGNDGVESFEGWIEVLRSDGSLVWNLALPEAISSLLIADINRSGTPELVVGTTDGQVLAYSLTSERFWTIRVNGSVNHILLVEDIRTIDLIVSSQPNAIDRFNNKGLGSARVVEFLDEITDLFLLEQQSELIPRLIVAIEDGTLRGINAQGLQIWQMPLDGDPEVSVLTEDSVIVSTDDEGLFRVDFNGNTVWNRGELGRLNALYWADLDNDFQPDVAAGNREGVIYLISGDTADIWGQLNLASEVYYINAFPGTGNQTDELVAVTSTGKIQLFRSRANRPPLLINPQTDVGQGSYSISVGVIDVENDPVFVLLETFDANLGEWVAENQRQATTGNGTLSWSIDPPENGESVSYRFRYDDTNHEGTVQPAPGPAAVINPPLFSQALGFLVATFIGAVGIVFLIRQSTSPSARVRRFYQRVRQQPILTLLSFEEEYSRTSGSPDFLLNLASMARRDNDHVLASLADGLFLLEARPDAALPIIIGALKEAEQMTNTWLYLDIWRATYDLSRTMLGAPTITELSLLRPQLVQLLSKREVLGRKPDPLECLLPVLTSARDSERVEMAEDRLVYLNEASGLLGQLEMNIIAWESHTENALIQAITDRWSGMIRAQIEELRGRAYLNIHLMTKQLVPEEETVVALEIFNVGRAPAELISVALEASPAYRILSPVQVIPFLPPAGKRQVYFSIRPLVRERFRVAFNIKFDDRNDLGKKLAFADMVHLLPPVVDFVPIINPYSPGTPLRRNSEVFFGREGLFSFIRENAGRVSQKNVLILVGQRRTGKTSALLHLDRHIPENLFSVYVDCQSLGVVPGMPALFHDIAWVISDAFAAKEIALPVPDLQAWQADPGGMFQRQFLTAVRKLLPDETTILLIFDEFEAFENLVNDNILPPTIFTYLRHLMQHAEGLSFIFAGTHRLEEMGTDYWSVLFNIALYRHVGFLDNAAATHLIRDPVSPNIIYDDLAVDKILRVTAGHPYFLQLVCYTLVNRANANKTGYITISDVNVALEEMLRLGEVHFAYLWQRSSYTEKALLAAVAHFVDVEASFRPEELVQYLNEYSIYLDPAEVTLGLNSLVEREIFREVTEAGATLYEMRIGLVGLWVAQNKSLTRLHDQRALQTAKDGKKGVNGGVKRPSGLPMGK